VSSYGASFRHVDLVQSVPVTPEYSGVQPTRFPGHSVPTLPQKAQHEAIGTVLFFDSIFQLFLVRL
jgi:hypothetical protein